MAADIPRVALAAAAQPVALVAVTLLEALGVDVPRVVLVAAEASAAAVAVAVDSMVAAVADSMAAVAADSMVAAVAPTVAADIANRKREVNKPVCFGRRAFFFRQLSSSCPVVAYWPDARASPPSLSAMRSAAVGCACERAAVDIAERRCGSLSSSTSVPSNLPGSSNSRS
jgi:L-fucose mutarotase/ribose pyranase (RbsD/FucU family)